MVGAIGPGLLVLAGIEADDTAADRDWLARKIVAMRIFADAAGVMNRSVQETGGDILAVSQNRAFNVVEQGLKSLVNFLQASGYVRVYDEAIAE